MKTESKIGHQAPQTHREPAPPAGPARTSSSSSSSTSSLGPAARFAMNMAGDLASLFDPLHLLAYPARPVADWPVRVLPAAAPGASALRHRADSDLCPDDFPSLSRAYSATPSECLWVDDFASTPAARTVPITTCRADTLSDTLVPVRGGNAGLASAMMPATHFCGFERAPAAWQVSRLRDHLDDGEWQQAAGRLPRHSPQQAVALAIAACVGRPQAGLYSRETQGAGTAAPMESVIVDPSARVPADGTPLTLQDFPRLCASTAIGSTYLAAIPGAEMACQDGIYLSRHATVVTDGLGGHTPSSAGRVRVAQAATGQLVAQLIEVIARTETRPAEFLRRHLTALLGMLDQAVASALVAGVAEKNRPEYVGAMEVRAAFVAVANLPDGTLAFGVGDCTAHLFTRGAGDHLRVVTFTPQPGQVAELDVGGLGDGSLRDDQIGIRQFPPGVIGRVVAGTDGVFDAQQGHLHLVDGRTPSRQSGPARVGMIDVAEQSTDDARDDIITRLTQRTRQFWDGQAGAAAPDTTALDDIALVVRDLAAAAPAGGSGKDAKDAKGSKG